MANPATKRDPLAIRSSLDASCMETKMTDSVSKEQREQIQRKVADAKHQSKVENAIVFHDRSGRWLFDLYMGHGERRDRDTDT